MMFVPSSKQSVVLQHGRRRKEKVEPTQPHNATPTNTNQGWSTNVNNKLMLLSLSFCPSSYFSRTSSRHSRSRHSKRRDQTSVLSVEHHHAASKKKESAIKKKKEGDLITA